MTIACLRSDILAANHGFFTRSGGVSQGVYASLNCGLGSKDNPEHVVENRARAAAHLGAAPNLYTAYQTHSTAVATVLAGNDAGHRPRADALVTRQPGLVLGILTADCAPILFHDAAAGVIGAAHAGWKGALGDVMENTILAMETLGATRSGIVAAIGPCISQRVYETGPEFIENFLADDAANSRFFAQGKGDRLLFDLPGFVQSRLRGSGVAASDWGGHCTFSDPERFFSYRRTTHAGELDYGRQISMIAL